MGKQTVIFIVVTILTFACSKEKIKSKEDLELEEDIVILQKSIAIFGSPQPHKKYRLPGPDVEVDEHKMSGKSSLHGNSTNFTYRLRTVSGDYSFIRHYEAMEVRVIDGKTISIVKGQVSEEIPRKNGGFYLRTIGYIFDENGFQNFLIDITKIERVSNEFEEVPSIELRSYFAEPELPSSLLSLKSGCYSDNVCSVLSP